MKLYKRTKNGTWCMRFNFEGTRIDQSTGFKEKQKAENYASAFRTKLINEGVGILAKKNANIPKLKEAMDDFHQYNAIRIAPSTFMRYKLAATILCRTFGKKRIDKITPSAIETYIADRLNAYALTPRGEIRANKKKISTATVNKELACLKKFYNFAISQGIVKDNPVCNVDYLKEENESGRVLNYEEEYLYLNECNPEFRDFATLLFDTGSRPGELCDLKVTDVDLTKREIHIRKGKTRSARRTIPLSSRALFVLTDRLKRITGEYVFPSGRGAKGNHRVTKFNGSHFGALGRSKIDTDNRSGAPGRMTLYSCRHTFATRFVESGGDLVTLAKLLGHANLKMVMRYAHPSDQHAALAIQRMAAAHQGSSPKVVQSG